MDTLERTRVRQTHSRGLPPQKEELRSTLTSPCWGPATKGGGLGLDRLGRPQVPTSAAVMDAIIYVAHGDCGGGCSAPNLEAFDTSSGTVELGRRLRACLLQAIVARRPRSCSEESSVGSGGGGCVDEARLERGNGAGSRSAAAAVAKHSSKARACIVNCAPYLLIEGTACAPRLVCV